MKHNKTMEDESFLQALKIGAKYIWALACQYHYVLLAVLGGLIGYLLDLSNTPNKKVKGLELLSLILLSGFFGYIGYEVIDILGVWIEGFKSLEGSRGSISGIFGLFSLKLYKAMPRFIGNLLKGKLNIKEDCKIDE